MEYITAILNNIEFDEDNGFLRGNHNFKGRL